MKKDDIVMVLLAGGMWVATICIDDVRLKSALAYASLIITLVVFVICGADLLDQLLKWINDRLSKSKIKENFK